jgi:hypothetical protein
MAISYSENNKRENIFEPLLSRQRLVYKGPIPSGVINLFNDQIFVDFKRLNQKADDLDSKIQDIGALSKNDLNLATPDYYLNEDLLMTLYSQQISFDSLAQEYVVTDATPYYNDSLMFNKPQLNSSIISFLNKKLDIIEDGMKGN